MRTRRSSKFVGEPSTNPTSMIPKRRNRRRSIQRVEPFSLLETLVVTMADQRTMAELLHAPTEGYVEAIVVPPIPAEHFELKHSLINLVTSKQFFGFEKEDPHAHIRYFNKITSTLKYKRIPVPRTSIKLILFHVLFDGPARIWLDKEPPRSILTWDDLKTDAFLAIEDDSISPEIDDSYYDSEGDIRLLEEFLNDDPSSPLPPQELRFVEPKTKKSSIDDPLELELKDLPSHLEYAFLEGTVIKLLEACLTNDSIPPGIDDDDFDPEGDLLLLEKLLNDDPSSPLPPKELHVEELKIVKSSIDDPPELELKDLPSHLEYAFLEGTDKLPVIIAKNLKEDEKVRLLKVLKSHKRAIAWKISDIKGIDPQFCTHKILMEDDSKPAIQHQRRVNPKIHEVIKKEVIKLLDAGLIYPISDSPWVSPVHCVPKKGGITVIENEDNELIPTRLVMGWRVCIDYRKLNDATRKDHFPLPFMDQMLERLAGNEYYCFLDGFSGYFQIPIDPQDQEKTTFTCPYGTFSYRRMPFGLCNPSSTFQRCMMVIFHDMIEETMEVFMDDFLVFGDSFS
ncbi:reverse transcriptase domain-containing protein [Tanacetum coccineum]|uniref:Reverse transcriptase domain-containing protein n=1 Tax=Tanacetum coccineum TaxID=301880 RepID=A0ABQ5C1Q3_9ASTR